jgi:hypothetical protein
MKRTGILACATLAFCLLASPLAAQEAAQQPAPQAEQLPPPPPFPPMPSSKPSHRWVDMGGHTSRARPKASSPRHHASPVKRDRKARSSNKTQASHKAAKSHKATASHRSVRKDKPVHFSAKTVRSCHAMTYRQIIRNSSCRAMIKQELAAPAPTHRTNHKASAHRATHHGTAAHSKTARRHSTAKRRSR